MPTANCLSAVPWFFPAFVQEPVFSKNTNITDETAEADSSQGLRKLTYTLSIPASVKTNKPVLDRFTRIQKATAVSIYYDSQTALPKRVVYHQAFDRDEDQEVEIKVEFSGYSSESGFILPHHIQRYVQNTLQLDFTVATVAIQ